MPELYIPKSLSSNPAVVAKHQAGWRARSIRLGLTHEIVRESMPSGKGFGFRLAFYQHGIEIKSGIQGLAEIVKEI